MFIRAVFIILFLATSVAYATEDWKVDSDPSVSWGGGVVAFSRDTTIMVYYGASGGLISLSADPVHGTGLKMPPVLGKPLFDSDMYEPAVSPDSNLVAWTHTVYEDIWPVRGSKINLENFHNVYYTDLRTGRVRKLTTKGGQMPFWDPGGRCVAYITYKNRLEAVDIYTGKVRVLANKLVTNARCAWLASGPAVAVEKKGCVAWYHIRHSGELVRVSPMLKLPAKPRGNEVYRTWSISRDGSKAVCADVEARLGLYRKCQIKLVTPGYIKNLACFDASSIATVGSAPDPWCLGIALSGNGDKYVLSLHGGLWRGDIRSGSLRQITHTMYW